MLFFLLSVQAMTQTGAGPSAPFTSKTCIEERVEREVNKAEDQLEQVIRKRDVASLDLLLADYYADAYEGSERASSNYWFGPNRKRYSCEFMKPLTMVRKSVGCAVR